MARANLGGTGLATFARTLGGVAEGGRRLAEEVRHLLQSTQAEEVALIGASLGGLYCRFAAGLLWPDEGPNGGGPTALQARPSALVTLATPHLGVRGLFGAGKVQLMLGQATSNSVADLMWDSPTLRDLSSGSFLAALAKFGSRRAYAPTLDDGIVAYPSAAISPAARAPAAGEKRGELGARRVIDSPAVADQWCGEDGASFAVLAGESQAVVDSVRQAAQAILRAGTWDIVDVHATHKEIATLYRATRSGAENPLSQAVAADIWRHLQR